MSLSEDRFDCELFDLRSEIEFLDQKIKKLEDAFSYTIGEIQYRLSACDINEKDISDEEKRKMQNRQEIERLAFKSWMEGNNND